MNYKILKNSSILVPVYLFNENKTTASTTAATVKKSKPLTMETLKKAMRDLGEPCPYSFKIISSDLISEGKRVFIKHDKFGNPRVVFTLKEADSIVMNSKDISKMKKA